MERLQSDPNIEDAWKNWEIYRDNINKISGLEDLVSTPFILKMVVEVLPRLVQKSASQTGFKKLMAVDLYEEFISKWFEQECEKQVASSMSMKINKQEYMEYAMNLAANMSFYGKTTIDSTDQDWREFFDPRDDRTSSTLRGVPLSKIGTSHSFIHKTVLEYFAALEGRQQAK